jgi:crotonobetainyl-CoA:carnitine CoA-transferase CaiB-like acyl-CoA transferase
MALEGIRIIDWTHWHQGPAATAVLADLGAEVIKVEQPVRGDGVRGLKKIFGQSFGLPGGRHLSFESHNRNKRGIAVDLSKEEGREIIYRLVKTSDVFVTNFQLPVIEKLGMSYEPLRDINPSLVYGRATSLGPKGPDSVKPGFDNVGLARSGFMMASGKDGEPEVTVTGIADEMSGRLLAFGIVVALLVRERTGIGQIVDASLLGSMMALQTSKITKQLVLGGTIGREKREEAANPLFNIYKCRDGKWVFLGLVQADRFWEGFCHAVGAEGMTNDPRFATMDDREKNKKELIALLDRIFASKTFGEWSSIFRRESDEMVFELIASYSDLESDPQVTENKYVVEFDHPALGRMKYLGSPVGFSETPASIRLPAPELGQHTEEVLIELCGYSWAELAELKAKGAIP